MHRLINFALKIRICRQATISKSTLK